MALTAAVRVSSADRARIVLNEVRVLNAIAPSVPPPRAASCLFSPPEKGSDVDVRRGGEIPRTVLDGSFPNPLRRLRFDVDGGTGSRERLLNNDDYYDDDCDDHDDGNAERNGKGPYTPDDVVVPPPRNAAMLRAVAFRRERDGQCFLAGRRNI